MRLVRPIARLLVGLVACVAQPLLAVTDGASGSIGDLVWNDLDNSGTLDAGEPGLDAVSVELWFADGSLMVASTVTAGGGFYQFLDVPPGAYRVRLSALNFDPGGALRNFRSSTGPLPGWPYEPAPDPDVVADDSDDNGTESNGLLGLGGYIETGVLTLAPAEEKLGVDFGVNNLPQIDLAVTKTDGEAEYTGGETRTYTIVVSNRGPADANGASVTDSRPSQASSWDWVCAPGTPAAYNCTSDATNPATFTDSLDLPQLASVTYLVTVQIAPTPTGDLVNTVVVSPPPGMSELQPTDNSATDTDTLSPADLVLAKTVLEANVRLGEEARFTLQVTNQGPGVASGVVVSDTLPAGLGYLSNDCGATFAAPTLTWNVGTLADGANALCTLSATVLAEGSLVNTATVAGNEVDPTPIDNTSGATVVGAAPAEVPTLDTVGLALLALALAALALRRTRRGWS
jgi:uncharacterized repeat protein (TIGR01451 family)